MNELAKLLVRRIEVQGPINLAEYMTECLMHPQLGYYSTRDPFGKGGDFTTAPEISQMFGELLGLALAQAWLDQGSPRPFTLAELGPGRGTLMADVLRATAGIPGFHAATEIHLVEASPTLRRVQRTTLGAAQVVWLHETAELPEQPLFLLANEFFDALPIRQFTRTQKSWRETLVGTKSGRLAYVPAPIAEVPELRHRLGDTQPGEIVEYCPAAPLVMTTIAKRILGHGGLALIIDYGDWESRGDTFQAMKAHQFADPLALPGEADLTAHVDFSSLASHAPAYAYTTQGKFLSSLGLLHRAERLAARLSGEALRQHLAATRRLTAPEEMGQLFKALAVISPNAPAPPGFA